MYNLAQIYKSYETLEKSLVLAEIKDYYNRISFTRLLDIRPVNLERDINLFVQNFFRTFKNAFNSQETTMDLSVHVDGKIIKLPTYQTDDMKDKEAMFQNLSQRLNILIMLMCVKSAKFKRQQVCYLNCESRMDNPLRNS